MINRLPGCCAARQLNVVEKRLSFDSLLKYVPDFTLHVMNVLAGRLSNAYDLIER